MKKIVSLFFVIAFLFSFSNVHADEQAFLSANKKKKGVVTTASGLQYEIVKKGNGQKPTTANQVRVHYIGTLTDGTEFDNSYKRGAAPTVFPLNAATLGVVLVAPVCGLVHLRYEPAASLQYIILAASS